MPKTSAFGIQTRRPFPRLARYRNYGLFWLCFSELPAPRSTNIEYTVPRLETGGSGSGAASNRSKPRCPVLKQKLTWKPRAPKKHHRRLPSRKEAPGDLRNLSPVCSPVDAPGTAAELRICSGGRVSEQAWCTCCRYVRRWAGHAQPQGSPLSAMCVTTVLDLPLLPRGLTSLTHAVSACCVPAHDTAPFVL